MTIANQPLPCAPEIEQLLLGTLIQCPGRISHARESLPVEAFHIPLHQSIFTLLLAREAQKKPTDLMSLVQSVKESGGIAPADLATICGQGLYESMAALYWAQYETQVVTRWQAREIIQAAQELKEAAWRDPDTVPEHINAILPKLQLCSRGQSSMRTLRELLLEAGERWQERNTGTLKGISTGFKGLDSQTGGFMPGELIVISGETKSGKTALAIQMACAASKTGLGAAVFSLEMADSELVDRIVASEAGINALKFRTGEFSAGDFVRLNDTMGSAAKWPLWITHSTRNLAGIQSECRKMKGRIRLAVVDYIQLVETTMRKGENREQQVASISRALKSIASECEITMIGLAQVNEDGKLRESRAIGQDANLVLAVERGDSPMERTLRVVVQRSGPAGGTIPLTFRGEYVRFE
jgi:replicative DNA helicase